MADIVIKQPRYKNIATGEILADWNAVQTQRLENPTNADYQYYQRVCEAVVISTGA